MFMLLLVNMPLFAQGEGHKHLDCAKVSDFLLKVGCLAANQKNRENFQFFRLLFIVYG